MSSNPTTPDPSIARGPAGRPTSTGATAVLDWEDRARPCPTWCDSRSHDVAPFDPCVHLSRVVAGPAMQAVASYRSPRVIVGALRVDPYSEAPGAPYEGVLLDLEDAECSEVLLTPLRAREVAAQLLAFALMVEGQRR